jgi:SCY1-like protein 1
MLAPLFYIAENFLDTSTVGKSLGTIIGVLFRVNDRAIRGTLLQKAPFMASSFDPNVLNEAVFEPMCSGFSDSSAALRELTLKSTAALVPHLTQPNLEKLCRYLVRLQQDQETSIRTNTVIFFSKIAPYLTETTRQKMLLPAFVRAMKDPFTPCRLAALKSTLKAKEFFNPSGVANRVMPAVTPLLVDPSAEVRREAFSAVEDLLFVLRQESERLNKLPEPQQQQQQQHAMMMMNGGPAAATHVRSVSSGGATTAASVKTVEAAPTSAGGGGKGFSLGGLSSWMTSKATAPDAPATAPPRVAAAPPPPTPMVPPPATMSAMNLNASNIHDDNNDDWGDEEDNDGGDGWGDDLDVSDNAGARAVTTTTSISAMHAGASHSNPLFATTTMADEDDFFGTFDAKPAKPVVLRKATAGKLVVPSSKSAKLAVKPAVKKLSVSQDVADGWDDF